MLKETPELQRGRQMRTRVLGEEHVSRDVEGATAFDGPYKQHTMEAAWGTVWTREGIDIRTKIIVTVSVLAALGRSPYLRTHIKGALRNGITPEELREIFIHVGCYAGQPAATEAIKIVKSLLQESGQGQPAGQTSS